MNKKKREELILHVLMVAVLSSPLLILAGGCEIAAWFFVAKSDSFDRDGIVTTATVYEVTQDRLGEALQANSDYQRNAGPTNRSKIRHWTLHYRFATRDKTEVNGSYNVQNYEEPVVGQQLDVRYLSSNPQTHEISVGHTESQGAALHWIAFAFVFIWLASILGSGVKALLPKRKTTSEKRIARMKTLQSAGVKD